MNEEEIEIRVFKLNSRVTFCFRNDIHSNNIKRKRDQSFDCLHKRKFITFLMTFKGLESFHSAIIISIFNYFALGEDVTGPNRVHYADPLDGSIKSKVEIQPGVIDASHQ